MLRQTLFRTIVIGTSFTGMGFYRVGEKLDSTPNTGWASGTFLPGTGSGSVEGKLLGGTIRAKGASG